MKGKSGSRKFPVTSCIHNDKVPRPFHPVSILFYMKQAVGILGGTFDPVHNGHLRLAIECREKLSLESVFLVPLDRPPHREVPVAPAEHRLAMLQLAVQDIACLKVDDRELRRGGVSYTIDTLRHLRKDMPDNPLYLITGKDAFNAIHTWREWQSITDYVHIIVACRPGQVHADTAGEVMSFLEKHRAQQPQSSNVAPAGNIYEIEIPALDISSTRIREILHAGKITRGLLPDSIVDYIHDNGLYREH